MKGIKRHHGTAATTFRVPLTLSLVCKLVDEVEDEALLTRDRKVYQAAILQDFHGFLRCGDFTANIHDPDLSFTLTCSCITIHYVDGSPAWDMGEEIED